MGGMCPSGPGPGKSTQAALEEAFRSNDADQVKQAARHASAEHLNALARRTETVENAGTMKTPLMDAIRTNSTEVLEAFLEDPRVDVNKTNLVGRTALMEAAALGDLSACKLLIERQADVHTLDQNGRHALMHCVGATHADVEQGVSVLELLLEMKASLTMNDVSQKTSLITAAEAGNFEMVKVLLEYQPPPEHLEEAVDVNASARNGYNALMAAVHKQSIDIVELLLQHGADVKMLSNDGWSPLLIAASTGNAEIIRTLCRFIEQQVTPNEMETLLYTRNHKNRDVLMEAILSKNEEAVVTLLEDCKYPFAVRTGRGKQIVCLARDQSTPAIVEVLQTHNAIPEDWNLAALSPRRSNGS